MRLGVAKIDLAHDREHRHLKQYGVQPRSRNDDVELARHRLRGAHVDKALLQMKQAEQIDKVTLEEAPATQIVQLAAGESQGTQAGDLALDLLDVRSQIHPGRAAFETILDLCAREMVQHDLHHRELVKVGVEKRLDDHADKVLRRSMPRNG